MYRKARIITSENDLRGLLQAKPSRVTLQLPGLDPGISAEWEQRLNRRLSDCGCAMGAIFLFLAIAGYGACLWLDASILPAGWLGRIVFGLLLIVASVCIGKLVGLLWSRRQFETAVKRLQHELTRG